MRQIITNALAILILTWISVQIIVSPAFDWGVFGDYFFDTTVIDGLKLTLKLVVIISLLTLIISIPVTAFRVSRSKVLQFCGWLYVYIFRGVPLLVQIIIWFNFAIIAPRLGLGLPFGSDFGSADTNAVLTPFISAVIGFSLHYAAYICEVFRGALLSVPAGQMSAIEALGIHPLRAYRKIILPQAIRFATPPLVSYLIDCVKATALVAFVGLYDLMFSVQQIYNQNFKMIPLLMVATAWYLIVVSILSICQYFIERRLGASSMNGSM